MNDFWAYVTGSKGYVGAKLTCAQIDTVFFTGGCPTTENRMLAIWNAIPSVENWDMIGMADQVNSQMKGFVRHCSIYESLTY